MKLTQFWYFGHVSKSLVAKSTTAMNPKSQPCSIDAATIEAKHVRFRQPPVDAVAAAEQDFLERHEDPRRDDARDANVDGATRGEAHERPVRQ